MLGNIDNSEDVDAARDRVRADRLIERAEAVAPTTMLCLGCGKPTTGSIGAAGIKWKFVCQSCKDEADAALARQCRSVAETFDAMGLAGNTERLALRDTKGKSVADHMQSLSDRQREIYWADYLECLTGNFI